MRYAICKQYTSKEGTTSDGIADSNRVKSCLESLSEESASLLARRSNAWKTARRFISGAESNLLIREFKVDF